MGKSPHGVGAPDVAAGAAQGGHVAEGEGDVLEGMRTALAPAVLEQLPAAVVVLRVGEHHSWRIVAANEAAEALTGYARAELLAPDRETRHPSLYIDGQRAMRAALQAGEPAALTVLSRKADGTEYWAAVQLAPLHVAGVGAQLWTAVVRDVSAQVASAQLERLRLAIERRARIGLSLVARVSDLLQDSDSADVLRAIADLLTRQLVSWAGFFVNDRALHETDGIDDDPPPVRPLTLRREAGERDEVLELLLGTSMRRVTLDADAVQDDGTLTGDLVELVRSHVQGRPPGERELIVLPVLGRQRTLGLLVAVAHRDPAALPDELVDESGTAVPGVEDEVGTVLELVARRVGMAMDNAQLYAREHALAETLQRAMLPEQADVAGLDVWTYYAPNAEHAQVGGDWYDVVNLRDGIVAVVIGDVVGHDVEAAASMGQLRSVVRAFAAELVDPGTVLGRVDTLVTGMRMPRTASLVYAAFTPCEDGSWDMAYSRAGHLPALRVRGGEVSELSEAGGTLVGFSARERLTAHAQVLPGDVMVFYTDGLIERRDRPMREGLDALVELCTHVDLRDAAGVGEELLQLADAPEDDVAMVVIRVPGGPEGEAEVAAPRRRRWQLPLDPASIGRARHAVRRACEAWGIDDVAAAELVISELMANAVMHGWGRITLRLQDTGDGLRIEVEDSNPAPPITRERSTGRVGGFGMHIVDRLADWGWRPTSSGKVVWARLRSEPARPSGPAAQA